METKTQTTHTVTIGRVEIGGGRIVAICETSGDSVTLEVPYGAVTEAVEKYLTDRLTRWDRDRIITMLTISTARQTPKRGQVMTLETFATRSLIAVTLAASGWLFFTTQPVTTPASLTAAPNLMRVIR